MIPCLATPIAVRTLSADNTVVDVQDFTYSYPNHEPVLRDLCFTVKKGEMLGIIGPNGAGKSTLCKSMNGLVPHFYGGTIAGTVTVADMETMKHSVAELSLKVGLVFQDPTNQFSGVSTRVDEEVAFGMSMMGFLREEMQARTKDVLKVVGLEKFAQRSPYELSGGQQQRLAIATVLAVRPEIIVMDEPTAQLDPVGKTEVLQTMRQLNGQGYTIIVAEHEIEALATFADRLIVLDNGRAVELGETREVLTRVKKLKELGIDPPSVTELCDQLSTELKISREKFAISLEEATALFSQILERRSS
jgi:energy-coupling factor transport system ATP-binding protein